MADLDGMALPLSWGKTLYPCGKLVKFYRFFTIALQKFAVTSDGATGQNWAKEKLAG